MEKEGYFILDSLNQIENCIQNKVNCINEEFNILIIHKDSTEDVLNHIQNIEEKLKTINPTILF